MEEKINEKFNSYNIVAIAVLTLLPLCYKILPTFYNSYFDVFDKI
jgi:hypothetical protein